MFSRRYYKGIDNGRSSSKSCCVVVFEEITGLQGLEQEDGWMSLHSLRI